MTESVSLEHEGPSCDGSPWTVQGGSGERRGRGRERAARGVLPPVLQAPGIEKLTKESIRENVEFRIRDFGIFTERREMRMRDFLSFGISEIMSMCVTKGIIDCSVCVCDGSGTAIVDDQELIQGSAAASPEW